MKLNCKRIDFTYTPGEEIFTFPDESGLPFIFDVEEELTADPAAMDVVGEMLDEAEKLAEKAKACGGTFSGNRPIQAVLCRDGGLFEAQAVRQSGG